MAAVSAPRFVREYPRNTLSCDMNECEDEYERYFASRCFFLLRRLAKVLRLLPIVECPQIVAEAMGEPGS